jgi:hypothetical protein
MWRLRMQLKEWFVILKPGPKGDRLLSASAIKWLWNLHYREWREKFHMWIVWHLLPREVVKWAAVRVMAHASQGKWGSQEVGTILMMDMLQRWDDPDPEGNNGSGTSHDLAVDSSPIEHINPSGPPPFIPYLMRWNNALGD